jgi:branched-chain amino acid aminotransferase
VSPSAEAFEAGVEVARVSIIRNHPETVNPLIKSNNLLNNALAMQEAIRHGSDEALMLNQAGAVTECSQSNFFFVDETGTLVTSPLDAGLLPGITRAYVLELAARLRLPACEKTFTPDAFGSAREAFITSTTREVMPAVRIDGRPVGNGRPGVTTKALLDAYRADMHAGA